VISEGCIPSEDIEKDGLIDSHYGAIAAKAVKQKPAQLTVQPEAQEEFNKTFNITWSDALKKGLVYNAIDALEKLQCTARELGAKYDKLEKGVQMVKFGGGFYCGKVDGIFVINGFYMNMRSAFTAPGKCIYYYETQFPTSRMSWAKFRAQVLGTTNPKTAAWGSLRRLIYNKWESLGLPAEPNTGENCVHASASPFEAITERSNWLGKIIQSDKFGNALLGKGIPHETIREWMKDPQVKFKGKTQSLFDVLEDKDGAEALRRSVAIYAANK